MSAAITKLFNPATYTVAMAATAKRAQAYYHPMVKDNGITPLWHGMLMVSVVMYTGTYISRVYPDVQHLRAMKKEAFAEYCEKHGIDPHH